MPWPEPPPPSRYLNHEKCEAYFSDPTHRFHQLWGPHGWQVRRQNGWACWGDHDQGMQYFDDAWWGRSCRQNWYSGNEGALGQQGGGPTKEYVWPHFTSEVAPALLGFDESIDWYCGRHGGNRGNHAEMCVEANVNILSLYGDVYNICRNVEWQVRSAKKRLRAFDSGAG